MLWDVVVSAILLANFPRVACAQNCDAVRACSARTDCYIAMSRLYHGQTGVAAGKARVPSDAARYRKITGSAAAPNQLKPKKRPTN